MEARTMVLAARPQGGGRARATKAGLATLLALLLIAASAVLPGAASAQGAEIEVTTAEDGSLTDPDVACPAGDGEVCTLRAAVGAAGDGDIVVFAEGVDPVLSQAIAIATAVTVRGHEAADGGPGTTISGDDTADEGYNDRLFAIEGGGDLTLENVVLTGGDLQGSGTRGGAVWNLGSLQAINARFVDNTVGSTGGAIANDGGTVTITGSSFTDNSAGSFGGAIANRDGSLAISGSSFAGNTAAVGGALQNSGQDAHADVIIRRSVFNDNTASSIGGAIDNQSESARELGAPTEYRGRVEIVGSTLTDNTAMLGGAISNWISFPELRIVGSTLAGNAAVASRGFGGQGGGLYIDQGIADIRNATFSGNTAELEGGAIFNSGASSELELTHVTVVGNQAPEAGGVFQQGDFFATYTEQVEDGTGEAHFNHTLLADNAGGDCGGSESSVTGTVTVSSAGYNLDSDGTCVALLDDPSDATVDDAMLGDLADNGGPTMTHLPLEGSPAINGGLNPTCLVDVDQRGEPRPAPDSGACDIGAVEVQPVVDEEPGDEPEELEEAEPAEPVEAEPTYTG